MSKVIKKFPKNNNLTSDQNPEVEQKKKSTNQKIEIESCSDSEDIVIESCSESEINQTKIAQKISTVGESDDDTDLSDTNFGSESDSNSDKSEIMDSSGNKIISYNNNPVISGNKKIDIANNINFNDGSQLTFDDIGLYHIKYNTNYKKNLIFDNNVNIVDKDEINMAVCNSYRASTIVDDKTLEVQKRTKGCIANIYTQDLKVKHEDKLPSLQQTDLNLQTVITQNPAHKFTSSLIVPPNIPINHGFERLSQNTLWALSHAFNISIFGGSYSGGANSKSSLSGNEETIYPYNPKKTDRVGPLDWSFVVAMMKTNFYKAIIFNHYGVSEQYKYFKSCPFRKVKIFGENGEIVMEHENYDQYNFLNTIKDKTQHVYKMDHIRKFILDLVNNGVRFILLNVKYDLASNQTDDEIFKKYCYAHSVNIRFEHNKITVIATEEIEQKKVK